MHLVEVFQKEIISIVISLCTTGILYLFRSRTELIWSSPHSWNFLITPPPPAEGQEQAARFNVYTAAIFVQNSGTLPATQVELTFNWEPPNWNLWPLRSYTKDTAPDGRFTLKFEDFAPKEWLQIELLANAQLPLLSTVRSKECVGKLVTMSPVRTISNRILYLRNVLIVLGIAAVAYGIIKIGSLFIQP
jgi:hypothetical protein